MVRDQVVQLASHPRALGRDRRLPIKLSQMGHLLGPHPLGAMNPASPATASAAA
jgi:hypothetical protein